MSRSLSCSITKTFIYFGSSILTLSENVFNRFSLWSVLKHAYKTLKLQLCVRGRWGHPLLDNNNLLYRHHRRYCIVKQRALHTHVRALTRTYTYQRRPRTLPIYNTNAVRHEQSQDDTTPNSPEKKGNKNSGAG